MKLAIFIDAAIQALIAQVDLVRSEVTTTDEKLEALSLEIAAQTQKKSRLEADITAKQEIIKSLKSIRGMNFE